MSQKSRCENCLTGKQTYALDKLAPHCPNLYAYGKKTCPMFIPLTSEEKKTSLFGRIFGRMVACRKGKITHKE